jgi:pimeloyl-ACP methyl ester carboxylesterase
LPAVFHNNVELAVRSRLQSHDAIDVNDRGAVHSNELQNLHGVAWKLKPSWYVLARNDQTVHPDLQRFLSKRINATTVEADSSHVTMLSQPEVVIEVIRKAAAAVQKNLSNK